MKTINIKMENRSGGPGRVTDELWNSWKLLDKGTLQENEEKFTLTNQNEEKFIAVKRSELVAAKMYNQHLSTDLTIFDVYEGKNPSGGYFILYRFKEANRRNEFVLAGVFGLGGGSSINFEIV